MNNAQFNYQYPYLYRYEDQRYIDLFFETGKILISSFHVYKSYQDNQLGDENEGRTKIFEQATDVPLLKSFVRGYSQAGNNHYCFCTSTVLDSRLFHTFSRDSVFRIKEMTGFAVAVMQAIEDATGEILFGNCDYLYERIVKDRVGAFALEFGADDAAIEPLQFFSMDVFGNKLLFAKLIEYQSQAEYRILWPTTQTVNASIVLECPEAIRYCEKVSEEELQEVSRRVGN